MSDKFTFLTNNEQDIKKLISAMEKYIKICSNKIDLDILNFILKSFKNNDLSLLTPQESHFLNHHDSEIWAQYLIFRYKFKNYPKNKIVTDFPIYLLIEPVSSCNLRCTMCFQIDKTFSGDKKFMGQMQLDLFKKIIDQAFEGGTKAITLASRGEPTLHPELGEMLEYCTGKFFELKLNTNATRLNEKLIHKILQSDVTDLVFSIDSYEKEDYESIRVNGVFENVLNNIKLVKEIKEKYYPNSNCATRISGVKVNKNQDPEKFKIFWEKYVDHVVMIEMELRWDTYNNPKEIMGKGPCGYLWERMYVWYDGVCNPCDVDYKSELALGSVKENSLKEIWHGDKYKEFRQLHSDAKRFTLSPCDKCSVGC